MSSLLEILKKYSYFSESGVILLGGIDNLDPYLAKVEKYYVFSDGIKRTSRYTNCKATLFLPDVSFYPK